MGEFPAECGEQLGMVKLWNKLPREVVMTWSLGFSRPDRRKALSNVESDTSRLSMLWAEMEQETTWGAFQLELPYGAHKRGKEKKKHVRKHQCWEQTNKWVIWLARLVRSSAHLQKLSKGTKLWWKRVNEQVEAKIAFKVRFLRSRLMLRAEWRRATSSNAWVFLTSSIGLHWKFLSGVMMVLT